MASTKAEKTAYNDAIKVPKENIAVLIKETKDIAAKKKKMPNIEGYLNLELAMAHIHLITLYLNMSDASIEILKIKNSMFLENARKEFYKVVQYIEEVVGSDIDRSLSENKEYLVKINKITIRQTLEICRKLLFVNETLVDKMGESSKWKWSFVDLHVRVANVIKNLINFSEIEQYRNFRSEYFQDREDLLKLCKKTLEEAAKQARNKYELSTQAPEDIKKAAELLTGLRSLQILYGETDEAAKTKNVIDALKARVEEEEKKNKNKKKS